MEIIKHLKIAGTGHRPEKLGGYDEHTHTRLVQLAVAVMKRYEPSLIITGMALGWDQALAEAAIALAIPFIAAVPFKGQESKWPEPSRKQYDYLLSFAKETVVVCDGGYSAKSMQKRNEWMVDHCDQVLALWNGSSGGTDNCIRYAELVKKPYLNIWSSWIRYK